MRTAPHCWAAIGCLWRIARASLAAAALIVAAGCSADHPDPAAAAPAPNTIVLLASQMQAVKIAPIATRSFALLRSAVGSIDFNEDLAVPVFSQYPGKIIRAFAEVGDYVPRGKTLYTIDSPDLLQAESTLIAAAGVAELTAAALTRAKDLYEHEGMAQKDYQQAVSDQMTAEAALKAARDAVRMFGKTDQEIDGFIAKRKVDATLMVQSPIAGRITARFAQPGLLVQPGNTPAPFTVADLSTMWMLANVAEKDIAALRVGQAADVRVMALGDRKFKSTVTTIGATVDPNTHTVVVRFEVHDPKHELLPGMIATFLVETGAPVESVAVPVNGVVREGDGTMTVWVTEDRHTFIRRTVTTGLQQDGLDQITGGLKPGELAVVDGAILLSNMLFGGGGQD